MPATLRRLYPADAARSHRSQHNSVRQPRDWQPGCGAALLAARGAAASRAGLYDGCRRSARRDTVPCDTTSLSTAPYRAVRFMVMCDYHHPADRWTPGGPASPRSTPPPGVLRAPAGPAGRRAARIPAEHLLPGACGHGALLVSSPYHATGRRTFRDLGTTPHRVRRLKIGTTDSSVIVRKGWELITTVRWPIAISPQLYGRPIARPYSRCPRSDCPA